MICNRHGQYDDEFRIDVRPGHSFHACPACVVDLLKTLLSDRGGSCVERVGAREPSGTVPAREPGRESSEPDVRPAQAAQASASPPSVEVPVPTFGPGLAFGDADLPSALREKLGVGRRTGEAARARDLNRKVPR